MKDCKHEWRSQFDLPIPGEWVVCNLCGLNSGRVEPYEAKRPSTLIRERADEFARQYLGDNPTSTEDGVQKRMILAELAAIKEHLDHLAGFHKSK